MEIKYSGEGLPILDVPLRYESEGGTRVTVGHWTPLEPLRCHTFDDEEYCADVEQTILAGFDEVAKPKKKKLSSTPQKKKTKKQRVY